MDPDEFPVELSTKVVTLQGPYGTVLWTVARGLYHTLPVGECDDICDKTGERIVGPQFAGLAQRLLTHVGAAGVDLASLDQSSSLEMIEVECLEAGMVTWQLTQGLWDAIPVDRRKHMVEMLKTLIHMFMEQRIYHPLVQHYVRKLALGDKDAD